MTLDVDGAIEYLEKLADKLAYFPNEVAYDSVYRIQYPSKAFVDDGEISIMATGQGIAFEEFGAGFEADTYDHKGFHTEPGIWSEDHAQTFQKYNGDPSDYKYNQTPKRYMREEAERLPSEIMQKAKEVFNDQ